MAGLGVTMVASAFAWAESPSPIFDNWDDIDNEELDWFVADNALHTFYHRDLEPNTAAAVNWAADEALASHTVISTEYHTTYDAYIDVVSMDQDYKTIGGLCWDAPCLDPQVPGPVSGWTDCPGRFDGTHGQGTGNPAIMCQQFEVRYDLDDLEAWGPEGAKRLACHELGHTVGFRDPTGPTENESGSCLSYTIVGQGGAQPPPGDHYSSHALFHLDWYRQYTTTTTAPPSSSTTSGGGGGSSGGGGGCGLPDLEFVVGAPGEELAAGEKQAHCL